MRVLSWNVQRLSADVELIGAEIIRHRPDIVALQEYQPGRKGDVLDLRLAAAGLSFRHASPVGRSFCSAVFARMPVSVQPPPPDLPEEHWSSYWCEALCGDLGVSCVHVPVSKFREKRRAYQTAILRHCQQRAQSRHIIIGDFNSTLSSDRAPNKAPDSEWLAQLEAAGWQEAWSRTHPEEHDYSWYSSTMNGFRIDLAWLPAVMGDEVVSARLEHDGRKAGLSDHSMLIVDLPLRVP